MSVTRLQHGLTLLERCRSEAAIDLLVAEFVAAIAGFGFNAVACGGWVSVGTGRAPRFYFNTWPAAFLTVYTERNLLDDDPIVQEVQQRTTPFLWRDFAPHSGRTDRANEMFRLVREHGWADGMIVPAHGPAGYIGIVSMVTPQPLDLDEAERACLWALALAIHDRCRTSPGMGTSLTPAPRLTPRELQCMRWVAAGKTEWEVGQLLGIAESTVHFHVARVKRRLETSRRTTAVALLVLHGLL